MSAFERETDDVLTIVHSNPNRRGITQTIGYIVTEDEARQLVAEKTHHTMSGFDAAIILLCCLTLAFSLAALIG